MARRTVRQVAKASGVSVRTLHHYDQIGLLKPAEVGANGYRYYGREELLRLQQILFYRELGFPLEEIRRVLSDPGFDTVAALRGHRAKLEAEARRYRRLVRTIDLTIAELTQETDMKDRDLYQGFSPERQARYEREIIDRFGEGARAAVEDSRRRAGRFTPEDHARSQAEMHAINTALADAMDRGAEVGSEAVQTLIRRHHAWVGRFWTPAAETYAGLGRLYVDHPEFRAVYEGVRPGLSSYLAEAMKAFAERSL